jgi:hypothetical protein
MRRPPPDPGIHIGHQSKQKSRNSFCWLGRNIGDVKPNFGAIGKGVDEPPQIGKKDVLRIFLAETLNDTPANFIDCSGGERVEGLSEPTQERSAATTAIGDQVQQAIQSRAGLKIDKHSAKIGQSSREQSRYGLIKPRRNRGSGPSLACLFKGTKD